MKTIKNIPVYGQINVSETHIHVIKKQKNVKDLPGSWLKNLIFLCWFNHLYFHLWIFVTTHWFSSNIVPLFVVCVLYDGWSYTHKFICCVQVKELKRAMHPSSLKELKLDEPGKANYTYKTLGAGFWALRQKDFREAIQDVVLEVILYKILVL